MPNKIIRSAVKIATKTRKQNKMLLKFLKQTKNGKYAEIEKSSIKYTRWGQDFDPSQINEEEYYYGLT